MISSSQSRVRECGSVDAHQQLIDTEPVYRGTQRNLQRLDHYFVAENARAGLRIGIIVIPVVVHIVHQTPAIVTDAQVHSQIDVLNQDYRHLNPDAGLVPSWFAGVAADARIEFRLAARTPDCLPTDGIHRVVTPRSTFSYDKTNPQAPASNPVKFTASDGTDAWPRDRYLNLWVCDLPGALVGYSSFPGYPADVDGVVIDLTAFGTVGTAEAPFNGGRTATHEIGHWLNLFHIWGDKLTPPPTCTDDDYVSDTPNQFSSTTACPTTTKHFDTCTPASSTSTGVMFMNFMDYTPDACMFMFTAGQVAKMSATLLGARAAILGSDALIPPLVSAGAPDLWSRNSIFDLGDEPDPSPVAPWDSDDIWVRQQDDGNTLPEHQNPIYRSSGLPANHVYVRVRNRACIASAAAQVKVYWAKASTGLGWPAPWDGSVTAPALMGGPIGSVDIGPIPGSSFTIVDLPWSPPNPADYASFGADKAHFCLLARIEEPGHPTLGMTFPEGPDLYTNVVNNNNISWKNVDIMAELPGGERMAAVTIINPGTVRGIFSLSFSDPDRNRGRSVFQWASVYVDLPASLYRQWLADGRPGAHLNESQTGRLSLRRADATIGGLRLDPGVPHTVTFGVVPAQPAVGGFDVYALDVVQSAVTGNASTIVGGQRLVIRTRDLGTLPP